MKKHLKIFVAMLLIATLACCFIACNDKTSNNSDEKQDNFVPVDYVSQLKLDMNSETPKQEVTVKTYVDGDTTHFYISDSQIPGGVLKARYLAINTPESTGKIEAYGHKASRFTKEKLQNAVSIIVEPDGARWLPDSTGSRYMTWVWYKPSEDAEYRNLNIEILQNGLAIGSSTLDNRYGQIAFSALQQAQKQKLNVFSGIADPELYDGEAIPVTLKTLRCNLAEYASDDENSYSNKKVAFDGIVARKNGNTVYVESLDPDPETGLYYGMTCYIGYQSGDILEILKIGNYVRMVGTVQYYEAGQSYQISGISYSAYDTDNPDNLKLLDGTTRVPSYQALDVDKFADGTTVSVEFDKDEETIEAKQYKYSDLIMSSTISCKNLTVVDAYTTDDEDSSSYGAITLTCETENGKTITIRTAVLRDTGGNVITQDAYLGKTINVRGIAGSFKGRPQIQVFIRSDITVLD